jgi:hypothetical protein
MPVNDRLLRDETLYAALQCASTESRVRAWYMRSFVAALFHSASAGRPPLVTLEEAGRRPSGLKYAPKCCASATPPLGVTSYLSPSVTCRLTQICTVNLH